MSEPGVPLGGLLDGPPQVITAGVDLFAEALTDQGVAPTAVDWRPPVDGTGAALAALALDPRTAPANATAVERLLAARPHVVDVLPAREAVGLEDGTLLHAGPPLDWEHASGPVRGAVIGALRYEGHADDVATAERLAREIRLEPCHGRGAVGPMAGVVSPSMPMWVVRDETSGRTACCTLNEGLGKVLRYGAYGDDVIDRLRWLERAVGPLLADAVRRHGPLDVTTLAAQALQMGDECHNRLRATTALLLRELLPQLVTADVAGDDLAELLAFTGGNDHFALNVIMPAAKAAADAARDIPGATMVVAMARNGTDFGIQTAGTGDAWFTGPAEVPEGLLFAGYGPDDANADIGDSTITETVGLGGFAMAAAPAIVRFVGGDVPEALRRTVEMYEITLAEHDTFQIPILEFRGTPVGIDATRIVRTGIVPSVNTGIAGKEPGVGQVGAGLVTPPMGCFADAVRALATRAQPEAAS